jgi:hypothetical protein
MSSKINQLEIPDVFRCGITGELMTDPGTLRRRLAVITRVLLMLTIGACILCRACMVRMHSHHGVWRVL